METLSEEAKKAKVEAVITQLNGISEDTGVKLNMVQLIWTTVSAEARKGDEGGVKGPYIVRALVHELYTHYEINTDICLREHGIKGSEDIGKVVWALCDVQLLKRQETDSLKDFDGLFKTNAVWKYLKQEGIMRSTKKRGLMPALIFTTGALLLINIDQSDFRMSSWWMTGWVLCGLALVPYFWEWLKSIIYAKK